MSPDRRREARTSARTPARGPARGAARGSDGGASRSSDRRPEQRVVHGIHPVRELLRAGRRIDSIIVADTREGSGPVADIERLAATAKVPVRTAEPGELDRLAPGAVHQGVVALAPPFPLVDLDRLLAHAEASGRPPLLVAVDGVTDPHNLGSIARTAEAVGAHGLVLPDRRSAPITPVVEKSAAGALAHLPVAGVTNLVRALGELAKAGVWSLGLDGGAAATLAEHPLASGPVVLVVGAEGGGLTRLVRERCDALVRLPMLGQVGSLNASVAAGVALYTLLAARGAERDANG